MTPPIRLLLVDDHSLFRESLSRLLDSEPDFQVAATCGSIGEALAALESFKADPVDLLLLDYDLGDENGLNFIRQARGVGYAGRIFIITAGMTDPESVRALSLGVCGIFLKVSPPSLLAEAIRKVMNGETWIDQRCIQSLVRAVDNAGESASRKPLTKRESAVLKGVFEGLSNKEIGGLLNISEASVKSALQQLFVKTGVRTRSQLVRVALEEHASLWGQRG
jgi:DNA-binding NarL/FixJ family response regulator